ncbi:hypothetical protein [Sphingomonas sp.]|uniref:hypothetical protein n=1 Tax=Sphingomonas sp. TaxID=28214 RepID=UPI003B3AE5C1
MISPFDALEQSAIAIGRRDRIAHRAPTGRFARLLRAIFGIAPSSRLANARLEALRSLVIALRQRGQRDAQVIADALDAGLTPTQIESVMRVLGLPTR